MELIHLLLHLLLKERAPQFLHHEIGSQLNLIHIFILIRSGLCNLTLPLNSVHSLLQSLLLILYTGSQRNNSFLSLLLLMLNILHKIIESILRLQLMLFRNPLLIILLLIDLLLAMQWLSEVIGHQLQGNQVLFHSVEHVLVSVLEQLVFEVLFGYLVKVFRDYCGFSFDFGSCSIVSGNSFDVLFLLGQVFELFLK